MSGVFPGMVALRHLPADARTLLITRFVRLFAYGFLSIILVLYLTGVGLDERQVGLLLSLTLVGDTIISLWLTTSADRMGRRRTLMIGAALMTVAGVVFALTGNFLLLLAAGIVGVISPSGKEVGPFLSVEQASLSHVVDGNKRTEVFAWYNLVASIATALGALTGGIVTQFLQHHGHTPLSSYRMAVATYGGLGIVLLILFYTLGAGVEWAGPSETAAPSSIFRWHFGLTRSRRIVFRLSGYFAIDAFAGGFVIDSLTAYWFHEKFGLNAAALGQVFFATNLLAGLSGILAARIARRFGLLNTMVFTHLPSNVLLVLVPLMPNLSLALAMLLMRFSISQMDVPTRQAYTMAVVSPGERSAAAGVTGVARTIGAALSPVLAGIIFRRNPTSGLPFLIGGSLKILYDLLIYRGFKNTVE